MPDERAPTTRVFVLKVDAGRVEAHALSIDLARALELGRPRQGILDELCPRRLQRARPGAGGRARDDARRVLGRQHQRRIAAHAEADEVRLLDAGHVEHGNGIALEERLAVESLLFRRVGAGIAARGPGDAAPATPEVAHLALPAAVVAAKLVDEEDRRAF